ncbi:hypothetical protein KC19_VG153000 [Ceratodon purpureus]|uniref:Uncharacterized protein n=1 Tax=Ceratodon purpureus TaxID=3225 RepID=A0A8T0HQZ4_CERPU|nr:hypothetical protein KC19_VG153000 [Ceratodon purpureus]
MRSLTCGYGDCFNVETMRLLRRCSCCPFYLVSVLLPVSMLKVTEFVSRWQRIECPEKGGGRSSRKDFEIKKNRILPSCLRRKGKDREYVRNTEK